MRALLPGVVAAALILPILRSDGSFRVRPAPPFPSDPSRWVGPPQTWANLRGRVVLLDVWTFGCVNCVRTIPWVRAARERYAPRGLSVVGIHTPEMAFERERSAVEAEVRRRGLDFPHLVDDDYAYWNALENRYWPALYAVDRCGVLRARAIGEVHAGEASGERLEAEIEALLAEAPEDCARR